VLPSNARNVVVISAEQLRPGRRTHYRSMKPGEQHPLTRQSINIRCANITTIGTKVGVTEIVSNNQQDIGPLIDGLHTQWGQQQKYH
jgi:hypothetical protein